MIALIQRVTRASVTIDDQVHAEIGAGLLVLVAAVPDDEHKQARRLAQRVLDYRVFADAEQRMNLSARDTGAAILAVPQFTLAADTRRGNRPGFSGACPPARALPLFNGFVDALHEQHAAVENGLFGADMQVALVNDGPVTFWLTS
ncbi:D-aminoacyl-tRNA deacylase [Salinisphaera aquimarina]|uniref:D-aminoacyl-tRNA deacylase n=1 Tax=Salinisphaera aquimarina TaxID=2094031 RepID=A0ABV7ELL6_9GAMM